MKKQFAALLTALSLLPTLALAQEYYTLPEIREQAKDGWHETYTDSLEAELAKDGGADTTERSTDKFRVITINAQTGEVTNPMDTSKNGWGDADYKGFIPWDKVK